MMTKTNPLPIFSYRRRNHRRDGDSVVRVLAMPARVFNADCVALRQRILNDNLFSHIILLLNLEGV